MLNKLLSYRTIPVLPLSTNLCIAVIKLRLQTLLTPTTKGIVVDADSGGAWMSRTTRRVSRNGIDGSTPGSIDNSIIIVEISSQDIIGMIGTAPTCCLNLIQEVAYIRKSTSPGLVRKPQKLDAAIDGNPSDNCDSMSVFSKVIGEGLSDSPKWDL